MTKSQKYIKCIESSENVFWKLRDLLPDDFKISLNQMLIPSSLTKENELEFLTKEQKLDLNHIWASTYFHLFAYVEEYITLLTLNLATDSTFIENYKMRAYLKFSEEEVKHQMLFRNYIKKFSKVFKTKCHYIDGEKEVASTILSNSKLGVLLLTYHLELVTQQHYLESISKESKREALDKKFCEILKCHWREEVQHAKLDLYKIKEIVSSSTKEEIDLAFQEYFNILDSFSSILYQQAFLNLTTISNISYQDTLSFTPEQRDHFIKIQHLAYIDSFIIMGIKNKTFSHELELLIPGSKSRLTKKQVELESKYYERVYEVA